MKKSILTIATALSLIFCFANTLTAQKTVVWKGGAPGLETAWNCDKNWSDYKVPDAFTDVIIPDVSTTTFSCPVIQSGAFEVNSIQLQSNAQLTIEQGAQLVVYSTVNGFGTDEGLNLKGSLLIPGNAVVGTSRNGFAQADSTKRQ